MSSKEELYKLLLDSSPYGTMFFAYGVCVDCNPRAQQLLGCSRRAILGTSLDDNCDDEPLALAGLKRQLNNALEDQQRRVQWELRDGADSELITLDIRPVGDSGRELVVTLFAGLESAAANHQRSSTADAIATSTPPLSAADGRNRNSKGPQTTQPNIPVSQPDRQGLTTAPAPTANPQAELADTPAQSPESLHVPVLTPDPALNIGAAVADSRLHQSGEQTSRAAVLHKLSRGKSSGQEPPEDYPPDRDLYFDNLTQLPNRQLLIETIRQYFLENQDRDICAAFLLVDLDHFKDINDSWGHAVGDQVLCKLARVISMLITEQSMVARMSGDEFLLFIPDIGQSLTEGAVLARDMATKVKELISHPIFYDGNEFILTASVGIALVNDHNTSAERALQYADTAMYEAKRKGRNGIAFFDHSIREKAQRQIGLNTRLRKAVDNQEFALFVQPQISLLDGSLTGGEALLRWVNADRVTNMPAEFIPLLESSGLIVDVGHWVIRTACEYVRGFMDDGLWDDGMCLGINISPRQFNDPQLLEVIQHSLESYNVDPRYLNFEVTENLVIEDVDEAIYKMEAIKELGSLFSIDDFGIGYSSMIYLKRLPFDWLKIDREFIRNIHRDPESRGVVEAILAVSRQYGLQVTAEGVEGPESLEILRKSGCDTYQGAHFSMPVPVERFRAMLAA